MHLRHRLRRTRAVAAAALVVAVAATARAEVGDYLGQPVQSIHLIVDGRETVEPALTRVVDVHTGQPLSMRNVRETVLHLFAMSRFDDVRVDATREGGGVSLRFDMIGARPVDDIRFTGVKAPGIDEGQLRKAVTERAGPSPPVTRIDELSRVVESALRTDGYLRARVTGHHEPHGAGHTALVFDVQPGMRAVIGAINVNGPEDSRSEFLAQLKITSGIPFERETLQARIDKYLASRRGQGYYEAKVDVSEIPAANEHMDLTFTVNPGRHVRVVFTGDSFPGEKKDLVPVEREGSVDEDLLEDSTARIEDALKSQGYKDAMAPHERAEAGGELIVTFRISRGQQYRVARVTINGNTSVPPTDLQPVLRVREGAPFSQASLDAEAGAIEDVYRRSGFAAAKVETTITAQPLTNGSVPVAIDVNIREGVRTMVKSVKVTGNMAFIEGVLLDGLRLQPGRPFVIASVAADRGAILVKYQNAGYENATVEPERPELNREQTEANIVYSVREGPQVLVDHVLIVGPDRTEPKIVEKELRLHPGDPLSRDAVLESQQRLRALGLYRSVSISELRHGEDNRRDLLVSVEEGPSRSVAYGGGFELARRVVTSDETGEATEVFDAAPRGSFEITWRNLFGTNRSATVFSSLTLHPQGTIQGERGVTEYRVVNTFREPKVFNTPIDGLVTLLLEQQFRSSFSFHRASATAEATRRLGGGVSVIGTYQIQQTNVYDVTSEQNLIDRVFPNVRLSSFSASVLRDTRNDQIDPTKGEYFSAYGQLAAKSLGGEVGFFKSFFRASAFRLLPNSRGIVLAGNAFLGVATGFPQQDASGNTIVDADGQPARDLPQSERFYAGGDTTMRGFALDQLGVRHIPSQPQDTINADGFPLGGNSELLFNVELRVPLWLKNLETHGFVDTGNVFRRAVDLDFGEFRSAVGFGFLYKSPVGPLRFDLGFKVHRLPDESPMAFFITFGRAF